MLKQFTLVLGVVLLGVGIWGSIIGGHDHVLVLFGVNFKHNAVHIASGALALLAGFAGFQAAKNFCLVFGLVYGLVAVLGFVNFTTAVTMLNLNAADNFLHLGIAAACLGMALKSKTA